MAEQHQQQGGSNDFGLPAAVAAALPTDPFEQLDVARKITSIALSSRVSRLEAEAALLRRSLAERDDLVAELQEQLQYLDASLADVSRQLAQAQQDKENMLSENASLANTVKKLNRDVSKLETFRKTLMQSLQEEDENSAGGNRRAPQEVVEAASHSTGSVTGEADSSLSASKLTSVKTQVSESGSAISEDNVIPHSFSVASYASTPSLTPPHSPPRLSASKSPTRLSNPVSPRRHSISFSSTRNMFDERSSIYSTMSSSAFDTEPQTGRTRVDGKEFFRQVRSRLSYEQFSMFLVNVKELNAHRQTREETLRKADEIFGCDNKDLYAIFEGLITRNLH